LYLNIDIMNDYFKSDEGTFWYIVFLVGDFLFKNGMRAVLRTRPSTVSAPIMQPKQVYSRVTGVSRQNAFTFP